MKKNIIYFMPDCPTSSKAGNITRCLQLLRYLNESDNIVDFLSLGDWTPWNESSIDIFNELFPNINLILVDRKINKKKHPIKYIFKHALPNLIPKLLKGTAIDLSNYLLTRKVTKILNSKKYDQIIISYASWASLINNIDYKCHLILDSHDFITAQSSKNIKNVGRLFQSEMNAIRKFDEVWTFSIEEKYIYEQFTNTKINYIPVSFKQKSLSPSNANYKYDIIYIASINPHNTRGINWFLENVLPLLDHSIHIHIIGKISDEIKETYSNITIHGMVDDIQHFYENARISICPMLTGTGVKIKVLESLSNNIPVVTNPRGVDGLSQKYNNGCLVADTATQFAVNINKLMKDDDFYDQEKIKAYHFIQNNHNLNHEIDYFKSKFNNMTNSI